MSSSLELAESLGLEPYMALYFEGSKSITLSQHKYLSFLSFKKCWLTHPSLRHYVPPPSASRVSHHTSLCPDDMHSPLPLLSTTGLAHCIKTPVQRGRLAWRSTVPVLCPSAPPSWGHNRGNDWVTEVVAQTPRRLLLRKKNKTCTFFGCNTFAKIYGIESFFVSRYRENYQFQQ